MNKTWKQIVERSKLYENKKEILNILEIILKMGFRVI